MYSGNSLVMQWLGLSTFMAMAWVQTLVGEQRSCKLLALGKNKNKQKLLCTLCNALPNAYTNNITLITHTYTGNSNASDKMNKNTSFSSKVLVLGEIKGHWNYFLGKAF